MGTPVAGIIYLVATPIGNLDDITLRALKTLREVDLIACEDTRHSRRLLTHFEISKPLISYHDHNEVSRADELVQRALDGKNIAVISDAGTPGIADPGFRVTQAALGAGVRVVPLPGASALTAALTASGLPTDSFVFEGFLPAQKAKRRRALEKIRDETRTVVFYESPRRIVAVLVEIEALLGERPIVLARELTKLHEEFLWGSAREIREELESRPAVKGEFVLLIGRGAAVSATSNELLADRVKTLLAEGRTRMGAIKQAARERGIPKRLVLR